MSLSSRWWIRWLSLWDKTLRAWLKKTRYRPDITDDQGETVEVNWAKVESRYWWHVCAHYAELPSAEKPDAVQSNGDNGPTPSPWVHYRSWESVILDLTDSGESISARTFNDLWRKFESAAESYGNQLHPPQQGENKGKRQERKKAAEASKTNLLRELAINHLFDFHPGPVQFKNTDGGVETVKVHNSPRERSNPKGLEIEQEVFLTRPSAVSGQNNHLDQFAKRIAEGIDLEMVGKIGRSRHDNSHDGVYCLAGDRGSGKSTVLNRIEWFCRNYIQEYGRPLLVRMEIGTTFDSKQFTLDMMSRISREGQKYCLEKPIGVKWFNWPRFGLGQVGRFCEGNLAWAFVSLFLTLVVYLGSVLVEKGFSHREFVIRTSAETHEDEPFVGWISSMRKNSSVEFQAACVFVSRYPYVGIAWMLLLSVIAFGIAHKFKVTRQSRLTRPGVTANRAAAFGLAALVMIGLVLVPAAQLIYVIDHATEDVDEPIPKRLDTAIQNEQVRVRPGLKHLTDPPAASSNVALKNWWRERKHRHDAVHNAIHRQDLAFAFLCSGAMSIVVVVVGILALPNWWKTYCFCWQVETALQAEEKSRSPEVPWMGSMAALSKLILPHVDGEEQLKDLDIPFLQMKVRNLLSRCSQQFGRVVVLIDDVDMLPGDQYGELFRILRPLSKERGVACVVCTPRFFYEASKSEPLGDLHSTIRQCYRLGLPDLQSDAEHGFQPKSGLSNKDYRSTLVKVLLSRLRFCLVLPDDSVYPYVDAVLDPWDQYFARKFSGNWQRQPVETRLLQAAVSRRELIREMELLYRRGEPFPEPFREQRLVSSLAPDSSKPFLLHQREQSRLDALKMEFQIAGGMLDGRKPPEDSTNLPRNPQLFEVGIPADLVVQLRAADIDRISHLWNAFDVTEITGVGRVGELQFWCDLSSQLQAAWSSGSGTDPLLADLVFPPVILEGLNAKGITRVSQLWTPVDLESKGIGEKTATQIWQAVAIYMSSRRV